MLELAIGKTEHGHSVRERGRAVAIGLWKLKLHFVKKENMSKVVMCYCIMSGEELLKCVMPVLCD